jgi:formiminotetrahydrofolate cyclodeaminase/Zn-dependent peptidase ImmA (M78 family)
MNGKLIELPTEKLLEKFGAGSHKPGSGSAAALQGMLSAQLILTVIDLTGDKKRGNSYQSVLPQLSEISSEVKQRIFPKLKELFQLDSEQFDAVIKLRDARDLEKRFKRRKELEQQVENALKSATETPIEIAKLCVELADHAIFIFNNAFKSARGDSGVANNSAVAVVAGCLSIIDLNLLSINNDEPWIEKTKLATKQLKLDYERLSSLTNNNLSILEKEVEINQSFQNEIKGLQTYQLNNQALTNTDIEELARKIHIILWKYKDKIWKKKLENPREILKPNIAIEKLLNYKVVRRDSLGIYNISGDSVEVAGIIDSDNKAVGISKKFSSKIQNFTLAHELGHALLHKQTFLHRDRAMDGSGWSTTREPIEIQADKFATYFLMPKKQVRKLFHEIFNMEKFFLNEDNIFALSGGSVSSFRSKCKSLRELSRIIASTESIYGVPFKSMAEIFNVSVEAMAIRLEELDLVEFESPVTVPMSF